jgi:hypothetical protein
MSDLRSGVMKGMREPEPDLTLGYIDRDGAEATDEALIFVGDDNEHTIHVKCPRAKAVARDIVQAASRIRGLKAQLADSEARCLKAGNRIEELVTALTAAKAMADAVEVFLTMDDPDDMAADGVTVLCVHAKALEEKVAAFRAAGG